MAISNDEQAAYDQRVSHDIEKFGCHIMSVFDPEGQDLNFSYSIRIQKKVNAPEAIVIGLNPKLGHALISHYHHGVRDGKSYLPNVAYEGFLDGFPIYIEPVTAPRHHDLMLGCERYYGDVGYRAVQLIYPTTKGLWPWEPGVTDTFIKNQPMLGRAWIE